MRCDRCDNRVCVEGTDCRGPGEEVALPEGDDARVHRAASEVEAEGYLKLTRLEEIILFAEKLGCQRIGVAFCVGLADEAVVVCDILARRFDVTAVIMCKVGGADKAELGLPQIRPDGFEAICNPSEQARVLNEAATDLNIVLGLCVGHDSTLYKASDAPVTTLAVKDRVLAHNPLAAVYCQYIKRRFY
jgi:uncharacterized metal-binding protein